MGKKGKEIKDLAVKLDVAQVNKMRWQMYATALSAGIPIVSEEVCAIICAMLLVHGNSEMFTHNQRLVCELKYAQKRFHIEGAEVPDAHFVELLKGYVSTIELFFQREHGVPDYINDLFQERYGFKFNFSK